MTYSYRYLSKKNRAISISIILFGLLLVFFWLWFSIGSNLGKSVKVNKWEVGGYMFFMIIILGVFFYINYKFVSKKNIWDKVAIDNEKLTSLRYGDIWLKDIRKIMINDLNKVFHFHIRTDKEKFKFLCLDFLGDSHNAEKKDQEALKAIADELIRLTSKPDYDIKLGKESTSSAIFIVLCIGMVLLVPALIIVPQKAIIAVPFIVPFFFIVWKKKSDEKRGGK